MNTTQKLKGRARRSARAVLTKCKTPGARGAKRPTTPKGYETSVKVLDRLIDEVGEDENHPLALLMGVIGVLIEKYEDEHVPELTATAS